jgi:hypothetical protein
VSSNAYIASDGKTVMKVGKTNDFWKRMQQIGLPMTAIVSCSDEMTALLIERELRHIAVEMGGIRHPAKVDWFEFDNDIYLMLLAFAESLSGFTPTYIDGVPNNEITMLRKQYVQQLKEMKHQENTEYLAQRNNQEREMRELKRQIIYLEAERDRLRQEIKSEHEKQYELSREARIWEGKYIELRSYAKTLGFIDEGTDI